MSKRRLQKSLTLTQNSIEEEENTDDDEGEHHNLQNAVKECARYIVCREGSKIPIKRPDIVKHLATTCQTPSGQVSNVISAAEKLLKKVYGYKLIQAGAKGSVQYIVVLTEECESLPSVVSDSHLRTMLVAALTHVYMSGGTVKEDDMWNFLSEAGLLDENDFVGRKTFTTTFTRQLYLTFTKVGDGELARNVFEWGKRATEEVPKMFLLNKMAEAFGRNPEHWGEQYKQATEGVAAAST